MTITAVHTVNTAPLPTNTGIVPPWLRGIKLDPTLWDPDKPIVPPDPDTPIIMVENENPGIVPPWLQ